MAELNQKQEEKYKKVAEQLQQSPGTSDKKNDPYNLAHRFDDNKLTKENFWSHMSEKYPEEMAVFLKWIDEFKKKADWEQMYGAIKYHQANVATQFMILTFFAEEMGLSIYRRNSIDFYTAQIAAEIIDKWFSEWKEKKTPTIITQDSVKLFPGDTAYQCHPNQNWISHWIVNKESRQLGLLFSSHEAAKEYLRKQPSLKTPNTGIDEPILSKESPNPHQSVGYIADVVCPQADSQPSIDDETHKELKEIEQDELWEIFLEKFKIYFPNATITRGMINWVCKQIGLKIKIEK